MSNKLSFQDLENTCHSLGAFTKARSKSNPDKDIILTIKKINGQEVLQTTRLSKMTWCARLARWLGFGGSTLKSVAQFLQNHEPYIPSYSCLKDRNNFTYYYTEDAINNLENLEKEKWKALKKKKIQGCEVFKRCLSNHNRKHSKKVYILLQDHEKTDLSSSGSIQVGDISHSWPNPMGIFQNGDEKTLCEHYKPPIIEKNEFIYLKPYLRNKDNISSKVLGFCYEYGLGTKKNMEEAIKYYREAANDNEYSACYNLARLLLKSGAVQEAIDSLKKAEDILLKKIGDAKKPMENLRLKPQHERPQEINEPIATQPDLPLRDETAEEKENRMIREGSLEQTNASYVKTWNKALKQIYPVFIAAYGIIGDHLLKAEYEQKVGH